MPDDAALLVRAPRAAVELLTELSALGFEVRCEEDRVIVRSGRRPLDDHLRARIRAEKAGLIALVTYLESEQPDPDSHVH